MHSVYLSVECRSLRFGIHQKKNASFCNGTVLGLWGRTDLERCCVCFGTKLGSEGRSTSESCKRRRKGGGEQGGIMPESNPPAGRLRTKNLFSTSGVTFTNYCLKVLPQKFMRTDCLAFATSLFLPPQVTHTHIYILIYVFLTAACQPSSNSHSVLLSQPSRLSSPHDSG